MIIILVLLLWLRLLARPRSGVTQVFLLLFTLLLLLLLYYVMEVSVVSFDTRVRLFWH